MEFVLHGAPSFLYVSYIGWLNNLFRVVGVLPIGWLLFVCVLQETLVIVASWWRTFVYYLTFEGVAELEQVGCVNCCRCCTTYRGECPL